jgi:hypothetical protein
MAKKDTCVIIRPWGNTFHAFMKLDVCITFFFFFTLQDASQELRSALETKARMGGGTAKPKGRRTMKRGQARTIHDLPKLNS